MSLMKKTSLSLSPSLVADLDYVSKRMGVSRSALVCNILAEPVSDMRSILDEILAGADADMKSADPVRFRGKSADLVDERVEQFKALVAGDDLFSN